MQQVIAAGIKDFFFALLTPKRSLSSKFGCLTLWPKHPDPNGNVTTEKIENRSRKPDRDTSQENTWKKQRCHALFFHVNTTTRTASVTNFQFKHTCPEKYKNSSVQTHVQKMYDVRKYVLECVFSQKKCWSTFLRFVMSRRLCPIP